MAEISLRFFPDGVVNSLGTLYSDHLEFTSGPVLPDGSPEVLDQRQRFAAEGAALGRPRHRSVARVTFSFS